MVQVNLKTLTLSRIS